MRCKECGKYIPEGLRMEQCFCGAELPKDTPLIEKENVLPTNESKTIERKKTQITTKLLAKGQEMQINDRIDLLKVDIFKKNLIWVIVTIIAFLRFAIRGNTTIVTMIFLIWFVIMVILLIAMFSSSIKNISRLKKDLEEKKVIILSAKVSSIEELKGGGKKGYEYEIYLEKNEANIKKVYFFPDSLSEIENGNCIKLTLTPNAHFVLSAERDFKSSLDFKQARYDRRD